ncbi:MAG: rhodanese-like domain-containing protein [Deltaproteobacteria bacterium]|nr:rhodanese-like domain-containing protein [Deltaproteobacteria bacterium]
MLLRLRKGLLSACMMVVLASVSGAAFNLLRPSGIPFVGDWSPKAVSELHAGDLVIHLDEAFEDFSQGRAMFIDARDPGSYASGHIPDSVNITPEQVSDRLEEVRAMLKTGKTLIAYCHDIDCPLSAELVKKLRDLGIGPIKVMPEGWVGWMDRGYPYE